MPAPRRSSASASIPTSSAPPEGIPRFLPAPGALVSAIAAAPIGAALKTWEERTMALRTFTAAAVTALALAFGGAPADAAMELKLTHGTPTTDPHHLGSVKLAERVKELTKGEIDIKIFPQGQLGSGKEVVEGLQLGTLDISQPAAAVIANFVPDLNVLNMPFLFRDVAHFEKVWTGPVADKAAEMMRAKGFRLLGVFTSGERHILSKRPVASMADLKGMKIRTVENPVHVAAFQAFGANPTAIAYPEVYGALQTGVVDGADAANINYENQKFYEVAPHWAMVSWLTFANPLIMSEKKFQSLTADQQKALLAAGKEAAALQRKLYNEGEVAMLAKLKEKGVKVTQPNQAPFIAAAQKVYDQFLKTDSERALLKAIQDTK